MDDAFSKDYIRLVCWSQLMILPSKDIVTDAYCVNALIEQIYRGVDDEDRQQRLRLQLYVLSELFCFNSKHPFPTEAEGYRQYLDLLADHIATHSFLSANNGFGWKADRPRKQPIPDIFISDLPSLVVPKYPMSNVECEFTSIKTNY
ncbi:hypothetical protein CA13_63360 [Planctomycetes bacterium CA13]|uniref:Uncharacterized protein n=1 Tax=Novipirellula herctigrandis TaxID=2527986 RepID=A0A5C5ZCI1_9BACT|nr:hypothetical protein CA13_63360 [Planctomycetes bacterium CA13]